MPCPGIRASLLRTLHSHAHSPPQAYRLTRSELLQLANLAPRTPVEVHLVVADCEARLGEAGVEAVLAAVEARIARPVEEDEQEQGAGAAGEGEGEGGEGGEEEDA